MFAFFGIEAPQRVADAWLAGAEEKKKAKVEPSGAARGKRKKASKGIGNTGALEKKKRKTEGAGTPAKKRSRLSMMSLRLRGHRHPFVVEGSQRIRGNRVTVA